MEFSGALPGERTSLRLNGTVAGGDDRRAPSAGSAARESGSGSRGKSPSRHGSSRPRALTPRPHAVYLRRTFTLLGESGAEAIPLDDRERGWTKRRSTSTGGKSATSAAGRRRCTCDITAAVRPGDNEVLIVVRDVLAIMDPDYVNPASPTMSVSYLDAPGGGSMSGFGDRQGGVGDHAAGGGR